MVSAQPGSAASEDEHAEQAASPESARRPSTEESASANDDDPVEGREGTEESRAFRLLRLEEAYTQEKGEWQLRVTNSYSKGVLNEKERDANGAKEVTRQTVKSAASRFEVEYGISDRLEIDAAIPVTWWRHQKGTRREYESGALESSTRVGFDEEDVGDVDVGFVYAIVEENGAFPAISAELGAMIPSGDEEEGFGAGRGGAQLGLAITKNFGRTFLTANLEGEYVWDQGRGFEYGLGVLHFLSDARRWSVSLELDGSVGKEFGEDASERSLYLTPGVTYGWVVSDRYRWQIGLGVPMGLTGVAPSSDDFGVVLQLQVEF